MKICSYPINIDVLNYHLTLENWDALSFNRSGLPEGHENYESFYYMNHLYITVIVTCGKMKSIVFKMREDITKKLNSLEKGELFECYSAFNGFAIYKTEKFIDCKYDS